MAGGQLGITRMIMFAQAVASFGGWGVHLMTINEPWTTTRMSRVRCAWFVIVLDPLIVVLVAVLLTRRRASRW